MRFFLAAVTAASALLVAGCEEPFATDRQLGGQLLLSSQFAAGELPLVRVTTLDHLGDPVADEALAAAKVMLRNTDGGIATLRALGGTDPTTTLFGGDTRPVISGLGYELELAVPGYTRVSSQTSVPPAISYELRAAVARFDPERQRASFELGIPRTTGVVNFFHLLAESVRPDATAAGGGAGVPIALSLDEPSTAVSDDERGVFFELPASSSPAPFVARLHAQLPSGAASGAGAVRLTVRTVSEDYYRYYVARTTGPNGVPNPKFVGVNDNIDGGSGLFGSYTEEVFDIEVE